MQPLKYGSVFLIFQILSLSCTMTSGQSVDRIMHEFAGANAPGAAVLVMQNDSILLSKAYGFAKIEERQRVTEATNFRLASVTKEFTAMCIMLLAERGQLSFDDTLAKFFPDFPVYGRSISIRHLLNHTSGLVDYESLIPDSQTAQVSDRDCLLLMSHVDSLYFPAGSKFQYSNTGYALLALIIEKVSGERFADFLKKNIFEQVGMTTTVAYEQGISSVHSRAYGYSFVNGEWQQTDQSVTSAVLGDGGIYSNVMEMSKWIAALFHHKLIAPELQQLAWSAGRLNDGSSIDYGFGWHLETYRNIRHPYHGGSTRGFRNHLLVFPDQQLMVIVLTNRNQGEPADLAHDIADLFLNR